ncbi:MAG: gamma-glutamyl-gamma-aminobutyrate hydrolase family protein [Acidobacteria bacterium]|nr:gamma-glutamyl-gamma-aminobutyrate hydrolase family protein [Acidobacteriota bacterium]
MNTRVAVPYRRPDKLGTYVAAARAAGLEPIAIHAEELAPANGYAGLLLTGGSDVDPALYGESAHPMTEPPDTSRDSLEIRLLQEFLRAGLPVFGICRGHQLMNVALGGTLLQHIEEHHDQDTPDVHQVLAAPGTRLAAVIGEEPVPVNSRHHQAIGRLAPGLLVSARAADGVIEAVELPGEPFVVAVQWHPEERHDRYPADRALFQAFAEAVRAR